MSKTSTERTINLTPTFEDTLHLLVLTSGGSNNTSTRKLIADLGDKYLKLMTEYRELRQAAEYVSQREDGFGECPNDTEGHRISLDLCIYCGELID